MGFEGQNHRGRTKGKQDEFFWIPAHCGIQINENASSGAKDAISTVKH
jgi:hypothetical protein